MLLLLQLQHGNINYFFVLIPVNRILL